MATLAFKKLEELQQKIAHLKTTQQTIEKEVAEDLLLVLKRLGAFQWDFEVLVGALVQTIEQLQVKPASKEALHIAGRDFLSKNRSALSRARVPVAETSIKN